MKSPITTQQSTYHEEIIEDDDMDQVVTNNAVDYNTNDSKYMYDDFTENDYIATGDIVTTSTVTPILNTQTHYTNSYTGDGTNILNDSQISTGNNQIGKLTGQNDIPVTQNTLNNSHKQNLYCDSTVYDLNDIQQQQQENLDDDDDESNKIGNNNYLRDHSMYDDRFLDASGNIIYNQNQPVGDFMQVNYHIFQTFYFCYCFFFVYKASKTLSHFINVKTLIKKENF